MALNCLPLCAPPRQRDPAFSVCVGVCGGGREGGGASSQTLADRLAGALSSQVFKETKMVGRPAPNEGGGGLVVKKNDLPNEKEDILNGTERESEKNILNR